MELKKRKEEGVWGRRSSNIAPDGRLADDGKRWDALSPRWTFYLVPEAEYLLIFILFSNRGESEGGGIMAGWGWFEAGGFLFWGGKQKKKT